MPELKSWEEIEQLPIEEQRAYLQQALQNREPIKKFSDIKPGDHLVRKKSRFGKPLYYHHFLCVEVENDGRPTIIHYYAGSAGSSSKSTKPSLFGSCANPREAPCVKEVTLPDEDFIKSESDLQRKGEEVERVVWPDELRRYPVEEVIKRARGRTNETYYDLAKNNCECFVMWSICGMNLSLQSATTSVTILIEGIMSLVHLCENLPKLTVDIIEQRFKRSCLGNAIERYGVKSLTGIGCIAGVRVAVALLVDVACLAWRIWRAKQKWDEGVLIKTRHEFIKEVVHAVILHFVRFGAGAVGFFIGQIFLPIPFVGGIVGGFVGSAIGHWLGKCISHARSEAIAFALEAWYCYIIRIIFPRVSPTQEATDLYRNFLSLPAHT